jgi:hypothetical protein
MNTLNLSNVILSDEMEKNKQTISGTHPLVDPVINRLATLNPLWTFVVTGAKFTGRDNTYVVSDFKIKLDNEELGSIGITYMGQRGNVIYVSNDRIGAVRTRSSSYRTGDADKAILTAKKMFGKMSPTERIQKAKEQAEKVVSRALWNKERERNQYEHTISGELNKWAEKVGFSMFLEYVDKQAVLPLKNKVTHAREKIDVLNVEMKTIEKVQHDFGTSKTALVVKDTGKYLVKVGDKVDLYDDNNLPVDMRMKMGMLKLVEDEQYLTDIGCKVSSEIFVLLVDDLTNVSEGQ